MNFSEMGITPTIKNFSGDKIKIEKVLNVEITVLAFKIEPSTKKPGTNYLKLQITFENETRVIFTGSKMLQDQISQVPEANFPFQTKIIKNGESPQFT